MIFLLVIYKLDTETIYCFLRITALDLMILKNLLDIILHVVEEQKNQFFKFKTLSIIKKVFKNGAMCDEDYGSKWMFRNKFKS